MLKATDGKGVNLVVNNVGGTVFAECIRSLAFEGRLAIVGHMDRTHSATIDLEALHGKRLTVFGVSNRLRNVTPMNVLVRARDQTAKLGDLMLAKALEGSLAQQITKPGQMLGDARYLSPEQTGASPNIDGRSDIFSLGVVFYELFTGEQPFRGVDNLWLPAWHYQYLGPVVVGMRSGSRAQLEGRQS